MNDLGRDLRALLEEKGAGAGVPMPDARLLRRARRRQLGTLLGGVVVAAAIVGASIVGVSALRSSDGATPGEPNRLVDTNVYGITITHPDGWYVVDPVEAGIEPPSEDLPRLVLWVSDTEPTPDTFACPGLGDRAGDGFVLTLQQTPLALTGEAARKWPVELSPMDVGTSASPCYPGWVFMRASWTSAGRTLEARVGIGAEVSEADRAALLATFASLRIAPTEIAPDAVVIASGTAGGEDWELVAEDARDGLGLTLQWPSGGVGIGGMAGVDDDLQFESRILGPDADHAVVVFGSTRAPIARVEAVPGGGRAMVAVGVIDVPDRIGGKLDAFVLTYEPEPGDPSAILNAYDPAGDLVATVPVTPSPRAG